LSPYLQSSLLPKAGRGREGLKLGEATKGRGGSFENKF